MMQTDKQRVVLGRRDTMELWPEWEQVLFANVSDEVAQDNLNECVHELLDKAAAAGAGTCKDLGGVGADGEAVFHCSECGCILSIFDKDGANNLCTSFICDYPRFCPECGKRIIKEEAE